MTPCALPADNARAFAYICIFQFRLSAIGLATITALAGTAHARGLEVYGAESPKQGEAELVYNFDRIQQSDLLMGTWFDKSNVERKGLKQHIVELEYGFTDKWSTAIYFDSEQPKGEDLRYVQTRAVATRYNFFTNNERFFNAAVYVEYYAPREAYLGGADTKDILETRIILDKDIGAWSVKLNPIFEKVVSGGDVGEGMEFELAAGLYRKPSNKMEVGLEIYDKFGESANIKPSNARESYAVPTIDYEVKDGVKIHVGYAFGLSRVSDDQVLTTRFEFEL